MAESSLAQHRTGIYEIVNTVNGKRYVGSAKDLHQRWREHRRQLDKTRHHNRYLQASWDRHGSAAFLFRRLLLCAAEHLLLYEQIAMDALRPEFNICPRAGSRLGASVSAETRARIAAAHRGRKHPPEFGAAISERNKGVPRPKSDEHRRKLSIALTGHSFNVGIPKSEEHRAKLSLARRGIPNPKNNGNKGRSGMKTDPEIVARQRESLKAAWAKRKAAGGDLRSKEASAKQAATLRATLTAKRESSAAT